MDKMYWRVSYNFKQPRAIEVVFEKKSTNPVNVNFKFNTKNY